MMAHEQHRLDTASAVVKPDSQAHLEFLAKQVAALKKSIQLYLEQHPRLAQHAQLLTSIVGIATQSAACILAEIGDLNQFRSARQLAAYSGLTSQDHQSGTSVHSKARLCKIGNAHLRRALYFPALVAIRRCLLLHSGRKHCWLGAKPKCKS
jgi:transposase